MTLHSLKPLIAIAAGSFALGSAEFGMMGVLPEVAAGLNVSVPFAGNFISSYAFGVCVGTLFLVFGRRIPPKRLLLFFAMLMVIGNALSSAAPNAETLIAARFIAGLPHGAYFGTATIVASSLAERGKEGQVVSIMVLGQTVANMLGVPGATLLSELFLWRFSFLFVSLWALGALVFIARSVPMVQAIPDAGLAGQFRFLKKPGPWLVIGAVLVGNTGLFCWWSYVSPWLTSVGGYASGSVPALLVLAGLGMVFGSLIGGRVSDRITPGKAAAAGQAISAIGLTLAFLVANSPVTAAAILFLCSFGMFFMSSPQQLLMVKVGQGGGEMIGSACVQVAYNAGNAFGAIIGQTVLNTGFGYEWPSLAGVPFALGAVVLLLIFSKRFEGWYEAQAREKARKRAVTFKMN